MPIIRSSRVLYSGCCVWYFVLWFFSSSWSCVELRVMRPVCRMLVYFHILTTMHGQNHIKFAVQMFRLSVAILMLLVCYSVV